VESEAAVADQADLAVESFEAAVGEPEADGGEDPVAVRSERAGEADEGSEPQSVVSWPIVCRSGALSSDQRVP
jgi:hypothetical protein